MRRLLLLPLVLAVVGCADAGTTDIPLSGPASVGATAIIARKTADAAERIAQSAGAAALSAEAQQTAVRQVTRDYLADNATTQAAAYQAAGQTATATRVFATEESARAQATGTATRLQGEAMQRTAETAQARAREYQATQTAEARASATAVRERATEIAKQDAANQAAEDAARKREESIRWDNDTEWLRKMLYAAWISLPVLGLTALVVVGTVLLLAVLYEVYLWVRMKRLRSQLVTRDGAPVIFFPNPRDEASYIILDPALLPPPTPDYPALPLPAEQREIEVNRGGQLVDRMPLNLIHGFDERDLMFLFRQVARGVPFSEKQMSAMELPYSRDVMGKQQDNTPYARFIDILVRGEIITGRGGPGNPSGRLVVEDPAEMMRRAKALPERGKE